MPDRCLLDPVVTTWATQGCERLTLRTFSLKRTRPLKARLPERHVIETVHSRGLCLGEADAVLVSAAFEGRDLDVLYAGVHERQRRPLPRIQVLLQRMDDSRTRGQYTYTLSWTSLLCLHFCTHFWSPLFGNNNLKTNVDKFCPKVSRVWLISTVVYLRQ